MTDQSESKPGKSLKIYTSRRKIGKKKPGSQTKEDPFLKKELSLKEMSSLVAKSKNRTRSDLLQTREANP